MHIVNFCSYAIEELLSGFDAKFRAKKPPQKKSRDQFLDETFMDWNLPEMDDEEYEKFVNQVDGFLRAWEKEYTKDKPNEPIQDKDYKPHVEDVMQYCSLEEVIEFLKDDKLAEKVLGKVMLNSYIKYKNDEWERYHQAVTDWEVKEYLRLY